MSLRLKTPISTMLVLAATACAAPTNAAVTMNSLQYQLNAAWPAGGAASNGTLIGNTLFDEISIPSLCRASVSVFVDPNEPAEYFSLSVHSVANFNHGEGWGNSGSIASVIADFTVDAPVWCKWSGSSVWLPSGGLGSIGGPVGFVGLTGDGSMLLTAGTYRLWGYASVGGVSDQAINGYGSFWFAVPTPGTLALALASGVIGRRRR